MKSAPLDAPALCSVNWAVPGGVTVTLAGEIAAKSPVALRVAKEAVNQAFSGSLADGILFERRVFNLLFATEDQKEGMAAFIEKRPPTWTGR